MAVNQEAAEALSNEVKELVKDLQDQNQELVSKVESLTEYTKELQKQIDDLTNRDYEL
jgi:gas vesicle protein